MSNTTTNTKYNTYKCLYGALVGDAAGAVLEFYHDIITEEKATNAMLMRGGGCIRVGPGQITDDGELALSLWKGLNSINSKDNITFPYKECLEEYIKWYMSMPFDMGGTCATAFEYAHELYENNHNSIGNSMIDPYLDYVAEQNKGSEANGALMRISSLPTWAITHGIHWQLVTEMAKADATLSHPNIVCQEVNAIYVLACIYLLHGFSPEAVLILISNYVKEEVTSEKVYKWFFEESVDINKIEPKKYIGHVRHAFSLAIYFLRNPKITYEEAIKKTLMMGGDTDTNAAIVGGLVACYQDIPEYMINPVLEFDSTMCTNHKKGHLRPKEYCVKYVL
jgi:ADP-ribosylglycohydrolase